MANSPEWQAIRDRFADILYSNAPLAERMESLVTEIDQLKRSHGIYTELDMELDSMARSAAENRNAPFLDVGKGLLTFCDSKLYAQLVMRGEDPRWIASLRQHEEEQADELRQREMEEENLDRVGVFCCRLTW
jgi:hypothetical protein